MNATRPDAHSRDVNATRSDAHSRDVNATKSNVHETGGKMVKLFLVGLMVSFSAFAEIPTGYFEGNFANKKEAQVFIKTVGKVKENTAYALLLHNEMQNVSLFKVEQLEDGTLAWIQIFQSKDNIIGGGPDQQASYSGQVFVEGASTSGAKAEPERSNAVNATRSDEIRILLTPTDYGHSLGCLEQIEINKSSDYEWQAFPAEALSLKGEDSEINYKRGVLSGQFSLDGRVYNGNFSLAEILPGLAVLRAQVLDSNADSGKALKKEISALVAVLYHDGFLWWNSKYFVFSRLAPGAQQCESNASTLEVD